MLFRSDNADLRLRHLAHKVGTINNEQYQNLLEKESKIKELTNYLMTNIVSKIKAIEGLFQEIPRRARMGQRHLRAAARAAAARALPHPRRLDGGGGTARHLRAL